MNQSDNSERYGGKVDMHVTNKDNWEAGFISADDPTCEVQCVCGRQVWISNSPVACGCGRIYWTEFRVYRVETEKQTYETSDLERHHRLGNVEPERDGDV